MRTVRQRHWKNYGQPNDTVFLTTTVLDFVHAFKEPPIRDLMTACILGDCQQRQAALHAFVVMTHHVHLLTTLPSDLSASDFARVFKANSARRIRPYLSSDLEHGFDQQRGLNRHVFWQRSFQSVIVAGDEIFGQKLDYIHFNPVKAGLAEREVEYRWSSAWVLDRGDCVLTGGLIDCGRLLPEFDQALD